MDQSVKELFVSVDNRTVIVLPNKPTF